jgi:hypothetical protein
MEIEKNIKNNIYNKNPTLWKNLHEKYSTNSLLFIKEIFNIINNANNSYSVVNLNIKKKTIYELPKGDLYNYIPIEIKNIIENNPNTIKSYTFKINNKNIQLFIVIPCSQENEATLNLFNVIVKKTYMIIYLLNFYSNKLTQNINIYLYLTEHKKVLPSKKTPLNTLHSNTAFTTFCITNTEINIYRMEEYFKVLIHELIHNLCLDFSSFDNTHINRDVLNIFKVKSDVNLFETYTEVWAEILNTIFISYNSTIDKNNIDIMIKKTKKMLFYEKIFSIIQCVKVLKHYNLKYKNIIVENELNKNYNEKTNILSYYVIKAIVITNINDFLEFCNGSLDFKKTDTNINTFFTKLIKQKYNDPIFLNYVKNIETININNKQLRMTIYG